MGLITFLTHDKTVSIEWTGSDTVDDVKGRVAEALSCSPGSIQLIYQAQRISGETPLQDVITGNRQFIYVHIDTPIEDREPDKLSLRVTKRRGGLFKLMAENDPATIPEILDEIADGDSGRRRRLDMEQEKILQVLGIDTRLVAEKKNKATKQNPIPPRYRRLPRNVISEDFLTHERGPDPDPEEEESESEGDEIFGPLAKEHDLDEDDKKAILSLVETFDVDLSTAVSVYIDHHKSLKKAQKRLLLERLFGRLG